MQLLLDRKYKLSQYTIGKLYIDNRYFCDTLEDVDRGLTQSMDTTTITKKKVYGETAIPSGTYSIQITYSNRFKKYLPLLLNVKGFEGVRIHSGNTKEDTLGCILVGENKEKGKVLNSRATFNKLYNILLKNKNSITITIK